MNTHLATTLVAAGEFFDLQEWLTPERIGILLRCGFLLFVLLPILFVVAGWTRRFVERRGSAQWGLIAAKLIRYVSIVVIVGVVLGELGFSLAPLLGAAGIVGVALAFASQTSVSNIISGVFLIAEKPFEVGDVITIDSVSGIVLSIDTLSIKLRTFDNKFVRIPNETIIKSQITNITRFPIRRLDISISLSYSQKIADAREILLEIADANPLCLVEPAPAFNFTEFADSGISYNFGVWVTRENFLALKNSLHEEIKVRFDAEGIEFPFPQLVVHGVDRPEG